MKTTGEIVFVHSSRREHSLNLLTLQQDGSRDEKKISHKFYSGFSFELLIFQILWREYLAISCMYCKHIKLVDLESMEVTTAFDDRQTKGKMCKRWHKLFVKSYDSFLELDSSSTKFTKMRQMETGKDGITDPDDFCYIPSPHNMIVAVKVSPLGGSAIHVASLDEPYQTVWQYCNKKENGMIITPSGVLYSSRHDALFMADRKNKTVWVLNPSTGKVLQSLGIPSLDCMVKVFLRGSQLFIVARSEIEEPELDTALKRWLTQPVIVSNHKIYNFSIV